jgi:hypothetical protein
MVISSRFYEYVRHFLFVDAVILGCDAVWICRKNTGIHLQSPHGVMTQNNRIWICTTIRTLISQFYVRFQVLTAASIKFKVFWDVAPCSHVEADRRFRSAYCHLQALMMEAVRTSETSVNFKVTNGHTSHKTLNLTILVP